jgi:alkanesulfonate monooxygenase SsuD/methylene tetrahydromethanopterin reductase-like flavin-dependent oxidoreductase (luciferase family)
MRVGVLILPEERWEIASERWRRAEALRFDHAWTYDHLTWRTFRDKTWFAAVPTLAAAAAVTRTIRIGTLVASPNFRHPVTFAKELMSLEDMSKGRLTLGFGAGSDTFDAVALGQAPWSRRERTERFEEFVTLLDALLTKRELSHTGRYYSARDARNVPGCVQQPRIPFALAATGPRGMALAARFAETWVWVDSRGAAGELLPKLDDACARSARDPRSLKRLALLGFEHRIESLAQFHDLAGQHRALGFTDLVLHWPRPDEPFRGGESLLEEIAAERRRV